jgi:hypothetical protein
VRSRYGRGSDDLRKECVILGRRFSRLEFNAQLRLSGESRVEYLVLRFDGADWWSGGADCYPMG